MLVWLRACLQHCIHCLPAVQLRICCHPACLLQVGLVHLSNLSSCLVHCQTVSALRFTPHALCWLQEGLVHLSNISSTKRGGSAKELVNKGGWAGWAWQAGGPVCSCSLRPGGSKSCPAGV